MIVQCIIPVSFFYLSSEYAEVADNVKKYFKKLCKRYFNEVYLKEKEEKERTPSPEHEKALKDLEEEEDSDSDDSSGSDSDTSEFGVSKKNKRNQKGKHGEKGQIPGMDPSIPPGMWPRGPGRGAMGPNGLTINAGTLENLQRLAPHGPRIPHGHGHGLPPLPPNAPPHIQQEYYAKLQIMQQRQRYMHEMMRRQQQHQQQRGGFPRYPPGMEGMPPSHMQHGMPPRPNHPDAYGNMMAPPNYPYPDHMMRPPYQQPHQPHPYRGHYPPYHNFPNNPQEHFRMPPPDYNEAAKEWSKEYKGRLPSQGDEASIQSPTGRKSRQTSVSSDGMGVKSPVGNATAVHPSHSNSPMDSQATSTTTITATTTTTAAAGATPQDKDAVKSDNVTGEKDETDTANVDQGAKPPSEVGSTEGGTPTRLSVSQSVGGEVGAKQQQPDNEAYKRGMEAAYKYHQEQMKKKQQQLPPPGYSPGHMTGDMNYGKKSSHQQQMMTPKQQESYMQWRQHQEAMWRSQQMGMPTPSPMGSPYSRNPPGAMYDNHGYHNVEGAEGTDAYKQQQQQQQQQHHEYQQQMQHQQYMMNQRRYMEDMYRQHRYGHPGMHTGSSPYPYGHPPGYGGRPPYHSPMDKPNADGNSMPPTGSPHSKPDAIAPGEEIPDYTDSLRKYAMGLTGSTDKSVENVSKSDKDKDNSNVTSSKEEEKSGGDKDLKSPATVEEGKDEKDDKTESKTLSGEVESTVADSKTKPSSEEKEKTPAPPDDAKKDPKSASNNITSPPSFPAADSTTHDGSTPDPTPNPQSRPSSQPSVSTAQNGHKGHYPPSMYPPQNAYGGWDGMPMHHMGYNRGMYPPPPMGRPESMEEYERYRMYQEQMMAMRQMPQDPYHGMGMPPGMSPYEMEQYHYNMMQGRMGGGQQPPHPQMGRGGYPSEGEQQRHFQKQGASHEEMKRYQMKQQDQQQMAAMQQQMRTYHHYQQQHHGSPYGPSPMGGGSSMPPDYPGMASPSAASMAGGQHPKMSAPSKPQQQGMAQQLPPTMPNSAAELNDNTTQEPASNKGE